MLSRNGTFQTTTQGERQMAAELCEILGTHLLEETVRRPSDAAHGERTRHYAARLAYAAFKVKLSNLDWNQFATAAAR